MDSQKITIMPIRFGLGVDYYVQLSIGYTIKNVTSIISFLEGGESDVSAKETVNDFGILLNVPVIKLINEDLLLPIDGRFEWQTNI